MGSLLKLGLGCEFSRTRGHHGLLNRQGRAKIDAGNFAREDFGFDHAEGAAYGALAGADVAKEVFDKAADERLGGFLFEAQALRAVANQRNFQAEFFGALELCVDRGRKGLGRNRHRRSGDRADIAPAGSILAKRQLRRRRGGGLKLSVHSILAFRRSLPSRLHSQCCGIV